MWFAVLIAIVVVCCSHSSAFLDVKHKSKGSVAVQVVPMKTFASEEPKSLIEFHCCRVGYFGL